MKKTLDLDKETQSKLRNVQIELLDAFVEICKKYNYTYYLAYGTLLGAIRHHGYIPWDDDIDVWMPYADYRSFEKIVKTELGEDFFYQTAYTDSGYGNFFSKIRKNNTLYQTIGENNKTKHKGIFIDIFPLTEYPKNDNIWDKWKLAIFKYVHCYIVTIRNNYTPSRRYFPLRFLPVKRLLSIREKIALSFRGEDYRIYSEEDKCFAKDLFSVGTHKTFENKEYLVPVDYDGVLKVLYGNYMKLPPIDERNTHNIEKLFFNAID